ncbi:hypothetical protein Btru_071754 [Bulinus truncatus]|nr:hypothetical protein Btru_071754 [Bulinus truncatus]
MLSNTTSGYWKIKYVQDTNKTDLNCKFRLYELSRFEKLLTLKEALIIVSSVCIGSIGASVVIIVLIFKFRGINNAKRVLKQRNTTDIIYQQEEFDNIDVYLISDDAKLRSKIQCDPTEEGSSAHIYIQWEFNEKNKETITLKKEVDDKFDILYCETNGQCMRPSLNIQNVLFNVSRSNTSMDVNIYLTNVSRNYQGKWRLNRKSNSIQISESTCDLQIYARPKNIKCNTDLLDFTTVCTTDGIYPEAKCIYYIEYGQNPTTWLDTFITYEHVKDKNDLYYTSTCTIKPNVTSSYSVSNIVVCMLPNVNISLPNSKICFNRVTSIEKIHCDPAEIGSNANIFIHWGFSETDKETITLKKEAGDKSEVLYCETNGQCVNPTRPKNIKCNTDLLDYTTVCTTNWIYPEAKCIYHIGDGQNSPTWTDKFITYEHVKDKNDLYNTSTCTIKPNVTSSYNVNNIIVCMSPNVNIDLPNSKICFNSTEKIPSDNNIDLTGDSQNVMIWTTSIVFGVLIILTIVVIVAIKRKVLQPQDNDIISEKKENTYDYADEVETHIKSPDSPYKTTDEGIYGNSRELNSYTDTGTLKYFILEKVINVLKENVCKGEHFVPVKLRMFRFNISRARQQQVRLFEKQLDYYDLHFNHCSVFNRSVSFLVWYVKDVSSENGNETLLHNTNNNHTIELLLIGNTKSGISATRNALLGKEFFKTTNASDNDENTIMKDFTDYRGQIITVVDGICIKENIMEKDLLNDLHRSFTLVPYGFSALLFVFQLGDKQCVQYVPAINVLKKHLGDNFIEKYCILVITVGDNFNTQVAESCPSVDWCLNQMGCLGKLFKGRNERVVLFDNKTENKETQLEQIQNLIDCVNQLSSNGETRLTKDKLKYCKK